MIQVHTSMTSDVTFNFNLIRISFVHLRCWH